MKSRNCWFVIEVGTIQKAFRDQNATLNRVGWELVLANVNILLIYVNQLMSVYVWLGFDNSERHS